MALFKGDAYIIVTGAANIDLSNINESTDRRLALDFRVSRDSTSSPNTGTVTIYNLSKSTRKAFETKDLHIDVYAGYESIKIIGGGDIISVVSEKRNSDIATTITFGDGKKKYDDSTYIKSHKEETAFSDILDDVSKSFDIDVKNLSTVDGKSKSSLSLVGKSKDIMNGLSNQFKFDWSIQDNEMIITDTGKDNQDISFVVNSSTGLLSTPKPTEKGVKLSMQLNPDIRPKSVLIVESLIEQIGGEYIADTVEFVGNNYGGEFTINIDAIEKK